MSSSDLSSLSSLPSSDEEPPPKTLKLKQRSLSFAQKLESSPSSPDPPSRDPSPPHEYVLADNKDIAFLVMFRSRFADAFPKNVQNLGPQDIEKGIVDTEPSHQVENLLCALLGLVLNRKKNVDREHYGRALEEALLSQRHQWPPKWDDINPIHAGTSFHTMDPTERLDLLRHLALWSLNTSELITGIIKESYKQSRQESDLNQPLSVQPWGDDGRKRRYWLIEGQYDTPFRIYRESNPKLIHRTWWSVASTIDEAKQIADELGSEKSQAGKRLSSRILSAIPRLEATEEKRKRKEYRVNRRAMFQRPSPGFSLYEGRTRGKRIKYTYSDEEDSTSDGTSTRRSARQSGFSTPGEQGLPTVTASGRQVRSRFGRSYGEPTADSNEGGSSRASLERDYSHDMDETEIISGRYGRESRGARSGARSRLVEQASEDDSDDEDEPRPSAEEWDGDDNDVEGKFDDDEGNQASDADSEDSLMDQKMSLVVRLPYRKPLALQNSQHHYADHVVRSSRSVSPANNQLHPDPSNCQYKHVGDALSTSTGVTTTTTPAPPKEASQDTQQSDQTTSRSSEEELIVVARPIALARDRTMSSNEEEHSYKREPSWYPPVHTATATTAVATEGSLSSSDGIFQVPAQIHVKPESLISPEEPRSSPPAEANPRIDRQLNGHPQPDMYLGHGNAPQHPSFAYPTPKWNDPPAHPQKPYTSPPATHMR